MVWKGEAQEKRGCPLLGRSRVPKETTLSSEGEDIEGRAQFYISGKQIYTFIFARILSVT
jgi:hypothetical protein